MQMKAQNSAVFTNELYSSLKRVSREPPPPPLIYFCLFVVDHSRAVFSLLAFIHFTTETGIWNAHNSLLWIRAELKELTERGSSRRREAHSPPKSHEPVPVVMATRPLVRYLTSPLLHCSHDSRRWTSIPHPLSVVLMPSALFNPFSANLRFSSQCSSHASFDSESHHIKTCFSQDFHSIRGFYNTSRHLHWFNWRECISWRSFGALVEVLILIFTVSGPPSWLVLA